jgi:hypothetical protein
VQIGAWCMSGAFLWETCCTLLCRSRLWYYATVCRHALADLNLNKGSITSPYLLTQTTVDVVVVHQNSDNDVRKAQYFKTVTRILQTKVNTLRLALSPRLNYSFVEAKVPWNRAENYELKFYRGITVKQTEVVLYYSRLEAKNAQDKIAI